MLSNFSVLCTFLGILFGRPLVLFKFNGSNAKKWNLILYADVCYVFSCNPVLYLLPQTTDGSKCNGHVTNDELVMLPS